MEGSDILFLLLALIFNYGYIFVIIAIVVGIVIHNNAKSKKQSQQKSYQSNTYVRAEERVLNSHTSGGVRMNSYNETEIVKEQRLIREQIKALDLKMDQVLKALGQESKTIEQTAVVQAAILQSGCRPEQVASVVPVKEQSASAAIPASMSTTLKPDPMEIVRCLKEQEELNKVEIENLEMDKTLTLEDDRQELTPVTISESVVARSYFQEEPKTSSIQKPVSPKKTGPTSFENWIGKNLIGLAASILIFIGVILLGVVGGDYISDGVRIAGMLALSCAFIAAGRYFDKKGSTIVTQISTGCGFGSMYITILLTNLLFHKISDITTFLILLAWLLLTIIAASRFESIVLSIVAHIGMIISVIFCFTLGIDRVGLPIVVAYQVLSIIVLVVGNMICFKKTYIFGLMMSMFTTVIASVFIVDHFHAAAYKNIVSFEVLFPVIEILTITALTYLVTANLMRESKEKRSMVIYVLSKVMWIIVILVTYNITIEKLMNANALWNISYLVVVPFIIHILITAILSKRWDLDDQMVKISTIVFSCLAISIYSFRYIIFYLRVLFGDYETGLFGDIPYFIPLIFLFGVFFEILYRYSKNTVYFKVGLVALLLDTIFMTMMGFGQIHTLVSILYLVVITAIYTYKTIQIREREIFKSENALPIATYFYWIIACIIIAAEANYEYESFICIAVLVLMHAVLKYVHFDEKGNFEICFEWMEKIIWWIAWLKLVVSFENVHDTLWADPFSTLECTTFSWILMIFMVLVLVVRYYNKNLQKESGVRQLMVGVEATAMLIAIANSTTNLVRYGYVFSIICMIAAVGCIIYGFKSNIKVIRIYGLTLVITMILKMVVVDVRDFNSMIRVIMFIVGGLLCFGISALYTKLDKMTQKEDEEA